MQLLIAATLVLTVLVTASVADEIAGYHFHSYYFQTNAHSTASAKNFRRLINDQIANGNFSNCSLNHFNIVPIGPHPIGSFETCCNSTSLKAATSWFMQNRAEHSVLLHPLTRYEVADHTIRAMWLGQSMPLDLEALTPVLPVAGICPHYNVSAFVL